MPAAVPARCARVCASRSELVPVSMMFPPKVSRSTIAAQSRGSVKVLVQPLKLSFDAIAGAAHLGHAIGAAVPRRAAPRPTVWA